MSRVAKSREKRQNDQNATAVTNNRNSDQCLLFLRFLYLGSIPEITNYGFLRLCHKLWCEGPKAPLRRVKDKNKNGKNDDNNDADDQEGNTDAADADNDNDKVYDDDDADKADEDADGADDDDVVG